MPNGEKDFESVYKRQMRADSCITLPMWKGLDRVISEYLNSISLQSMLDQAHGFDIYVIMIWEDAYENH